MQTDNHTDYPTKQYIEGEHPTEHSAGIRKYDYYAFISYKRVNWEWAKWLRQKLQDYRLPHATCKRHGEIASRLSPVFLDKMNLMPGMLDEGLRTEVQSAKYLIVLCSHAAHDQSKYLDEEIQYFLDGGAAPSQIIPFVIEPSEDPTKDCYPLRLQELCAGGVELSWIDACTLGKRNAFLELVARMHGLEPERLKRDERNRRLRNTVAALAGIVACLALGTYGGYRYWDYYVPKTTYYEDYTERYGIPEGLSELTKEQTQGMSEHYTIITVRGKVRELRHEDAYGELISHGGVYADRPTHAIYEYTQGVLDRVIYQGSKGEISVILDYTDETLQAADLIRPTRQGDTDAYIGGSFLIAHTSDGSSLYDQSSSVGLDNDAHSSNIVRYLFDYDEQGFLAELRYASDTRKNYMALDADGIGGIRYQRDEQGRMTGRAYLYHTGSRDRASYAEDYVTGGPQGTVSGYRLSYDARGHLAETQIYDADGVRQTTRYEYNAQNNRTRVSYYNAGGEPVMTEEGVASYTYEYDAHGNVMKTTYYGTDGGSVLCNSGYASVEIVYDAQGRKCRESYFDTERKPVADTTTGAASVTYEWNEQGLATRAAFYGTDGQPVLSADHAYAVAAFSYDGQGNRTGMEFFGVNGEPVMTDAGFASCTIERDAHGNEIRTSYFRTDGRLADRGQEPSVRERAYDDRDNLVRESYFDADGKPKPDSYGRAANTYAYDERGNTIRFENLGVHGELIMVDGYAALEVAYDEWGNEVKYSFFGTDDKPMLYEGKFAGIAWKEDAQGNLTEASYYGTDGQLMEFGGYAIVRYAYDAQGNRIEERFYGTDGKPYGYQGGRIIRVTYEYDEQGTKRKMNKYDAQGNLISVTKYDESGNIIT
ncbi:MAG: TIR domain-containing protein [Lachnospiraceae bacterium]|nr:TIR domain-containing protein [Lachnospiraceae bacterium]